MKKEKRKDRCPKCEGELGGLEYALTDIRHYDGVSEWVCLACGYREGRFCGQQLKDNEVEAPYCQGKFGHARIYTI